MTPASKFSPQNRGQTERFNVSRRERFLSGERSVCPRFKFIQASKDRPFFLNYWCFSVHGPWDAKKELVEKYRAQADPKSPQRNPVYGAMVHSLDENVGRLLRTIDELGLTKNTIIVFFSDNGGVHFREVEGAPVTSNAPLRGGKATLYEGGTREPCIIVWPGVVTPGSRSDALISSIDFHPTLLEMAGLRPKEGLNFDGISIVPALRGERLRRDTIFCHFPHYTPATGNVPGARVRKGDWKLIRFYADNDDLGETNNLAGGMPAKVKELNALLDGFLRDTQAVVPRPNSSYKR